MLAEQRRSLILDVLGRAGSVSVTDLHTQLGVSRETIRRDITKLAEEEKLRKTHGGALAAEAVEPAFDERMAVNIDGKRELAAVAAAMVPDGASVIIDSGTTTLCLADCLMARHGLTVYTNDIHIAARLSNRNGNRVFLVGGEVQGGEGAVLGRDATRTLSHYLADFCFIGACAISHQPWLLDYTREGAEWREAMIVQARHAVLLADVSKFGISAPFRVQELEKVSTLVTDKTLSRADIAALGRLEIEVVTARAGRY